MIANKFSNSRRRGMTLLEVLIFSALWIILAVSTMRVIGDARMLRANARDRAVMTLIAQEEIERVRQLPPGDLTEGREIRTNGEWPSDVTATVELAPREDGAWLVDVRVERKSIEGKPSVRLTTIRAGGVP